MSSLPKTMRTWQYTTMHADGTLPSSLKLLESAPLPVRKDPKNQHIVKVAYCALNPVDFKPAESPLARRFMVPNPATPGIDFSGTIVEPASNSDLKPGDRVWGAGLSPFSGGCLAEYAVTGNGSTLRVPDGLSMLDVSTLPVATLTAWQTLIPHIDLENAAKPQSVLINGGSGGCGIFGIQIAKAMGVKHVTAVCSTRNIELCRSLGADEVIDYTAGKKDGHENTLVDQLKASGRIYTHIIDNVLTDTSVYFNAHHFTTPEAKYIVVAGSPTYKYISSMLKMKYWPSVLGGGKRKVESFLTQPNKDQASKIGALAAEGKIRTVIDEKFQFENAREAISKLRTGRARGKIVVEVCGES